MWGPSRRILPAARRNEHRGWGLIAFDSLASYEAYRARLKEDTEARANFALAQAKRFVPREERTFLEVVGGTFGVPSTAAENAENCPDLKVSSVQPSSRR
jgi:hypothetical protein